MNDDAPRDGAALDHQRVAALREGIALFDLLAAKGWLLKDKDGKPVDGLAVRADRAGALLDSTNPDARAWYWGKIRDNIASQGFDWFWLDETEPDLVPDGYLLLDRLGRPLSQPLPAGARRWRGRGLGARSARTSAT